MQAHGRHADLEHHLLEQEHYLKVVELLAATRAQLRTIYASQIEPALMRQRKQAAFTALRQAYAGLKASWGGSAPFETWFGEYLNNAYLASIATYYKCVPGFQRELAAAHGDLSAFYRRVHQLAKLDQEQRDADVCGAN